MRALNLMTEVLTSSTLGKTSLYSAYNGRLVHGGLTETQWPAYMSEIYRILKPRFGWVQCAELQFPFAFSGNGKLPEDSALTEV